MSYTPTNWIAGATKLGPTNLNHLELGVQAAAATADAANTLAAAALPTPAGSNGQFLKRVGGVWVPTTFLASDIPGYPSDVSKVLAGDGTWKQAPKVTAQLLSSGPPSSPADGDIWIALAVDTGNLATTNGTTWHFRYNASSGSANKWEFEGGADLFAGVLGNIATTSLTFVALTSGPTLTVPRSGDYLVELGVFSQNTAGFTAAYDSFANVAQTGVAVTSNAHFTHTASFAGGNIGIKTRSALTAAATLDVRVDIGSAGGTNTFSAAWISLTPVRIS